LNSPSIAFFHPSSPNSWNSFNRFHLCIHIHVYTLFIPHSPSYPFPCHPSPQVPTPAPDRTCPTLLFSDLQKKKYKT
jgi:hypothetical protein